MDYTFELLQQWIKDKNIRQIREMFEETNVVDLAEMVEQLTIGEILFLFKIVKKDYSSEVFTYLSSDKKEEIVNAFSSEEIKAMLDNIFTDDIVDFLEELPANLVKKVVSSASVDTRAQINILLSYPENSAGSLMSVDFVELAPKDTIKQAIRKIKKQGKLAETINMCFVVDETRTLVGTIRLRTLIFAKEDELIEELMDTDYIAVNTMDDQEEVVSEIQKYDMTVMPVVNNQNRLVGIVTVDDIIDVLEEEVTEDIQKMMAIMPLEDSYMQSSVWEMAKSRIMWLLILMVSATFTGSIIGSYEHRLLDPAVPLILAGSIPLIMNTAGNAGMQSSIMVIRGIIVDDMTIKDLWKVFFKELQVAFLCGLVIFVVNGLRIMLVNPSTSLLTNFVLCFTIFLNIIIAKVVGGLLPLLALVFKQDPAAMAAPLITTIVDALCLMVYFQLAVRLLGI